MSTTVKMKTENIKQKLDEYMETATPEQVVKEFEDLDVEFIEQPMVEIVNDKIVIYNFQRKGSGSSYVGLSRVEAALYYIELHKFLFNEKQTV